MRLRKAFLWSMIVSLSLAALLGISALILPPWFRYDDEILLSTVLFGAFSLVALVCASVLEKRRLVPAMWIGIMAAAAALLVWLVLIWFDPALGWRDEMRVARIAGTFTIITVLLGQSGLLTLPRLDYPWAGGVRWMTIGLSSLLAATGIALV